MFTRDAIADHIVKHINAKRHRRSVVEVTRGAVSFRGYTTFVTPPRTRSFHDAGKFSLDFKPGPSVFPPFSPRRVATRHKILIQPSQSYHETLARESRSSNLASALREIELPPPDCHPPSAWIKYVHQGTAPLSNVKFFFRVIYAPLSCAPRYNIVGIP